MDVMYRVGYETETGDLKAYALDNMLIVGKVGTSVENIVDSIIFNLVNEYCPMQVGIEVISEDETAWTNPNRQLPHFSNQKFFKQTEAKTNSIIDMKYELVRCLAGVLECAPLQCNRHNIIYVNLSKRMMEDDEFMRVLGLLAKATNKHSHCHLIVAAQRQFNKLFNLAPYFRYRILTKVDKFTSLAFLDSDIASREREAGKTFFISGRDDLFSNLRFLIGACRGLGFYERYCKSMRAQVLFIPDHFSEFLKKFRVTVGEQEYDVLLDLACDYTVTPIDDRAEYYNRYSHMTEEEVLDAFVDGVEEYVVFD